MILEIGGTSGCFTHSFHQFNEKGNFCGVGPTPHYRTKITSLEEIECS
jgi:hypothetical protein